MKRAFPVASLLIVLLVGACFAGAPTTIPASPTAGPQMLPILVSSETIKGSNRFLFTLTDPQDRLIAAPEVKVHLRFYDVDADPEAVAFEADATFMWAIEGERGLYRAEVTFPDAGRWATRFDATFPDGTKKTVRVDYDVAEKGTTPPIGAPAPSVDTPTLADVDGDLSKVTTDQEPDRRFYETSVEDALAAGKPFVLIFATPAFCQTRTCGPTLETVKRVAKKYPDLTFINVEPYVMESRDCALQPVLDANGQLQAAPWTTAWGLHTEPYTAVVDADGNVLAKFEGTLAPDELTEVLDGL
jgi:hypothetical protein